MKVPVEEPEQLTGGRREFTPEEKDEMFLEFRRRIERDSHNPFFFSGWVGNVFVQELRVNEETVRQYLEECIIFWRSRSEHYAIYYVDAFQSLYTAIFRETYPVEEQVEETNDAQPE